MATKAQQYAASVKPDRDAWRAEQPQVCMNCGGDQPWLEIHEIARKSRAPGKWGHRSNYLLLCADPCHSKLFASMGEIDQLALKKIKDPDNYDLQTWLELYDRAVDRKGPPWITEDEVDLIIAHWDSVSF